MDPGSQQSLARIEDALWPPPAGLAPTAGAPLASYLAVPNAEQPRFLLPRERGAAIAVLRHFRSDGTRATRRRIAALRLAIRLTGGWPLAGRATVSAPGQSPETIETYLASLLGPQLSLGIHLGPPRANRKPILQILGPDNEPRAFGKLGVDPLTRGLVARETDALRTLGSLDLPGIRLPKLVHAGDWRTAKVLITTPLPLARAERTLTQAQRTKAMITVARALGTHSSLPGSSSWLADRRAEVGALTHRQIREHLLGTLDHLAAGRSPWEFGSWHGDWTVWNTAALGGDVLIWDWERFDRGVPLGWDALHDWLREAFVARSPVPGVARDLISSAPTLLAPFGVGTESAHGVAHAYLVELALRYTADGQREAGGRTARVEEWLLPLLPSL